MKSDSWAIRFYLHISTTKTSLIIVIIVTNLWCKSRCILNVFIYVIMPSANCLTMNVYLNIKNHFQSFWGCHIKINYFLHLIFAASIGEDHNILKRFIFLELISVVLKMPYKLSYIAARCLIIYLKYPS